MNYATSSGARFANTGACADYASAGGSLVPLPDLVVASSCVTVPGSVRCTINVKNQGSGPATGTIRLDGVVTIAPRLAPNGVSMSLNAAGCANGSVSSEFLVDGIAGTATCNGPLAPGASLALSFVLQGEGATSSVVTITGAADPTNAIAEASEANNTFTRAFTL